MVKHDFVPMVPRHLGVLKQVVSGNFEPNLTHSSSCKLPKSLEPGNYSTDNMHTGVKGDKDVFKCHGLCWTSFK